jgi:hypothetical protein
MCSVIAAYLSELIGKPESYLIRRFRLGDTDQHSETEFPRTG